MPTAPSSGPSARATARVFLTVAGLAALLYLLYLVRSVVGLVLIATFLAIALGPPVDFLSRRRVPRGLSILLIYGLIGLTVFGVGLVVVPPIVGQVNSFAGHLPQYLQDATKNKTIAKYDRRYRITPKLKSQATKLPARLGRAVGALRDVTVGVFGAVVQLLTVLTLAFFLLLDGKRISELAVGLARPSTEARLRTVASEIYRAVSGYVAGNLIISVIAGTVTYVTLTVLGVPFAVPLAVLMAFLDLVPLIGATIGGALIGVITLFNHFPTSTIGWFVVLIVYQQIENNVIQPVVYRRTVNVQPLVVIISILIGAALLGVLGALVAIPVAGALQIVARDAWARRGRAGLPDEEGQVPQTSEPTGLVMPPR